MVVLASIRYIDGADKLHNKWMVLSMLVLSLIAFAVPLHPSFHNHEEDLTESSTASNRAAPRIPTPSPSDMTVHCWCPQEFTSNYVAYTNQLCKLQYLEARSGREGSRIYLPLDSSVPVSSADRYHHKITFTEQVNPYEDVEKKLRSQLRELDQLEHELKEDLNDIDLRVQELYTFQIPLMFLVFALVLLVPRIVWALLHDCLGVPTPQAVLETVKNVWINQFAGDDVRKGKSPSLSKLLNQPSWSQSALHLINKVLSIIVVIALLAFVSKHAMQEVNQSKHDQSGAVHQLDIFHQNKIEMLANTESKISNITKSTDVFENGLLFMCDFKIRQLQSVQTWTVQCVATENSAQKVQNAPNEDTATVKRTSSKPNDHDNAGEHEGSILEFESRILEVAMALLAILMVCNVLNTICWFCRLMSRGHRLSLGLPPNASMDTVLVVGLVRSHGGMSPMTITERQEKDFEELKLNE